MKNPKKQAHSWAAILAMLTFLLGLILFFYLIIPQLYGSILQLATEFDSYYKSLTGWINQLLVDYPQVVTIVNKILGTAADSFQDFVQESLIPLITSYMTHIASGVIDVVIGVKNSLIGLIIAIYAMLYEKKLLFACKRLTATFFSAPATNRIFILARRADNIFSGFISGKILDSIIIGILCFILMSIFKIPYAVLISVIVCVTNVIPFFGPFIGAIPSCLLLLLIDPWQAVYFGILILLLQQFDGNVLGPMILGDSTGLNPFWVVVVILVGGGLFGFAGMVLGLPIFSFFYSIFKEHTARKAIDKDLPVDDTAYEELFEINPETGGWITKTTYPSAEEIQQHNFGYVIKKIVNHQKNKFSCWKNKHKR